MQNNHVQSRFWTHDAWPYVDQTADKATNVSATMTRRATANVKWRSDEDNWQAQPL